jgi:transposase IS116/IS110/IS902 family protein
LNAEIADHTRATTTTLVQAGIQSCSPALGCWVAPPRSPASSGQTVRVRLNRSGDRQLNQALHVVILIRLRNAPATRAYTQRRRAQGKTNREIKRCLVRYIARQLYRLLEAQPAL